MAASDKSATILKKIERPEAKKKTKQKTLKYEDKSAGQPELVNIFNGIKALMKPYEKGSLKVRGEKAGMYNLVSEKAIEVAARKRDEVYFVTILVQKGYVGFYFMPIYANTKLGGVLKPGLMKCLKGKACFHIRKKDVELLKQIDHALKIGYDDYKKRGWVD